MAIEIVYPAALNPRTLQSALQAAFPGEGFALLETADGVLATCDNEQRTLADLQGAVASWNGGFLDRRKAERLAELDAHHELALLTFSYRGHRVHITSATKSDIEHVLRQLNTSGTVTWKFDDGAYEPLNKKVLSDLSGAIFTYEQACYAVAATMAWRITNASDVDALAAVDILTGWPPVAESNGAA